MKSLKNLEKLTEGDFDQPEDYDIVDINEGAGFNKQTGKFRAPVESIFSPSKLRQVGTKVRLRRTAKFLFISTRMGMCIITLLRTGAVPSTPVG